jgi:hypothetical protein
MISSGQVKTCKIPAELHKAVMALSPDARRDREKVNEAVRRYQENHNGR